VSWNQSIHYSNQEPNHVEPDTPPSGKLGIFLVAIIALMVVSAFGVKSLIYWAVKRERSTSEPGPSALLKDVNQRALERISGYDVVNRSMNQYRIPVDQAINEMVRLQNVTPFNQE